MATPIRIKRSAVPGKVPNQGALQYGELALNINDAELYTVRNRVGVGSDVVKLGAGSTVTNILYVTPDGSDTNTGKRLGDAKRTIGAAVTVAGEGTIIKVSAGSYVEDNPIVLPKQISIVGDSLREVSVTPQNQGDVFYVTNGNYISDFSFTGVANTGAIFSFNPSKPEFINQSPYIRNCTNFIPDSIGIKVDGLYAIGPTKSIVTDSFTQYNSNGIGVSITNEGYAQIVAMFTICSDISVYTGSGGQCDLNACNSSFGNYGLVSDGISTVKYTGLLQHVTLPGEDTFTINIDEPIYSITNVEYDNNSGLATVTLGEDHNYVVGVAITIGNVVFNTNETNGVDIPNLQLDNVFEVTSIPSTNTFTTNVGPSTLTGYSYSSSGYSSKFNSRPYSGQIVYFDLPYYFVNTITLTSGGSGYTSAPEVTITDPVTDFGIPAIAYAEIENGSVSRIDLVTGGRGYISEPTITIAPPDSGTTATATLEVAPVFYTIKSSTPIVSGITTITINENVPYGFGFGQNLDFHVQSKILASSHGFQYIGSGVTITTALPNRGGVSMEFNEVDERNGGIIVYTSTDQLGQFKIGDGIVIDQSTGTITGDDYTRSLFTTMTPLILALGGD
jgi:hypothetical protein